VNLLEMIDERMLAKQNPKIQLLITIFFIIKPNSKRPPISLFLSKIHQTFFKPILSHHSSNLQKSIQN